MAVAPGGDPRSEEAVSAVVGTVLMLAITVVTFSALGMVAIRYMESDETPARAEVGAHFDVAGGKLMHRGGDTLALASGRLILNVGGVEVPLRLDDPAIASQTSDGKTWRVGESLCIVGPGCVYEEADVQGVVVVHEGQVILDQGPRAGTGASDGGGSEGGGEAGPGGTGVDLQVTWVRFDPQAPAATMQATPLARITNTGTEAAAAFQVHFTIDGADAGTVDVAGLAAGGFEDVAASSPWTAVVGLHVLKATADSGATVAEDDETDNAASVIVDVALTTADPGEAFYDVDKDGVFDPAVDVVLSDEEEALVRAGNFDAGSDGLVIPASFGPITVDGDIHFQADGEIRIDVPMESTGRIQFDSKTYISLSEPATAEDKIQFNADTGIFLSEGALGAIDLHSEDKIEIHVQFGNIDLRGANLTAGGHIDLQARDAVDLRDANLTSGNKIEVSSQTGDVWLDGASFTTPSTAIATAGSSSHTIHLDGASIDDDNDTLQVKPMGVIVSGTLADGAWAH